MKILTLLFSGFILFFSLSEASAQCAGTFLYQYDGPLNHISFKDTSTAPSGWGRVYTNWNFGDGTSDTGQIVNHVFPYFRSYTVKRDVRFAQTGNPSNFCTHTDSVWVDSLPLAYNYSMKFHVHRLNQVTYGLYSYYFGCPLVSSNFNVDTGFSMSSAPPHFFVTPTGPTGFYVYTLSSLDPRSWDFEFQTVNPSLSQTLAGNGALFISQWGDSTVDQPTPPCKANFFLSPDSTDMHNWVLTDYSSGTNLGYSWDFGDSSSSTSQIPSHTYSYPGNHTICLTVSNGTCSDTWCDTAFISRNQFTTGMRRMRVLKGPALGIEKYGVKKMALEAYPNPTSDQLTITDDDVSDGDLQYAVFDMLGREIPIAQNPRFIHSTIISVSTLAPGMYLLSVKDLRRKTVRVTTFTKK